MAIDPYFKLTRERTVTSGENYQLGQAGTLGGAPARIVDSSGLRQMTASEMNAARSLADEIAAMSAPRYSAAVRVHASGLRWRKYFDPDSPKGVDGEEQVIEAKGQIFVPMPRSLKPHECDALGNHRHCVDMPGGADHAHGSGNDPNCCMVLEKFPVTVHFAVPLRDPIIPNLGDNLIVTIERRP